MKRLALLLMFVLGCAAHAQDSITLPTDMVTPDPQQGGSAPAQGLTPGNTITLPAPGTPGSSLTLPGGGGAGPGLPGMGMAPGGAPAPPSEVQIQVVAFKGSATGRSTLAFDDELRPMKKVLESLTPNDTFEIIASEKKTIPMGEETRFTVNGIYTAYVTAMGVREAPEGGGQLYDLQTRVEMLNGNDYIDALRARGEAAPQQALALRGMDLDVGELIVLVVVSPDSQNQDQSQQGDEQDQQEQQEQQESQEQQQAKQNELKPEQQEQQEEKQDEEKKEEGEGEGGSEAPQLAQQEGEGGNEGEGGEGENAQMAQEAKQEQEGEVQESEPKDMQTIDAILQNLEEKDRQEQRNARYRRSRVVINGDWW